MSRAISFFFFSSRRRHTRCSRDWSSDVCSSDLPEHATAPMAVSIARATQPRALIGWLPFSAGREGELGPQSAQAGAPERNRAAIEADQITDDCEPQAGPRYVLIEARSRSEGESLLLCRQAGAVVLDHHRQAAIVAAARYRDAATRPFAGIVHQVAEHFLQVLLLAAEDVIGRD